MGLARICLNVHVLTRHSILSIIFPRARLCLADGSLPVLLPELVLQHSAHLCTDPCQSWVLSSHRSSPPRVCVLAPGFSCVLVTWPSAGLLHGESGGSGHCHPLTHCFALFTICRSVVLVFIPSFLPFTSPSVPLCAGGPALWWMAWSICHTADTNVYCCFKSERWGGMSVWMAPTTRPSQAFQTSRWLGVLGLFVSTLQWRWFSAWDFYYRLRSFSVGKEFAGRIDYFNYHCILFSSHIHVGVLHLHFVT